MAQPGTPTAGSAAPTSLPTNITLRIVILAHGHRTQDDLHLVLSLDSTIRELKQQIQQSLPSHPTPASQRLIYFGRALLDDNATIRSFVRQTNESQAVHLVINSGLQQDPSRAQQQPVPAVPQVPYGHGAQVPQIANDLGLDPFRNAFELMQTQLQTLQQQLNNHPGIQVPPPNPQPTPQGHERTPSAPPAHAPSASLPGTMATPAGPIPQTVSQGVPQTHLHPHQNQHPHIQSTRIQETIGPNGERIRTIINNNNNMTIQMASRNFPNPLDRPSSAPGASPTSESLPGGHSANQPPPVTHPMHLTTAQNPPFPFGRILPPPPAVPGMPAINNMQFPSMRIQPMLPNQVQLQPNGQTFAWLLNSPSGPQGIVFAPGHGYFNSTTDPPTTTQQPTPAQAQSATSMQLPRLTPTQPAPQPQMALAQAQPPVENAARPAQPAGAAQQVPEVNELMNHVWNRVWLFLRLYMFIFVLSESGTWRRVIMLSAAIIFCLLPRQNPLNDMFQVIRRHIDGLLGPPQLAQQPGHPQQANQPGQAGNAVPPAPQPGARPQPGDTTRPVATMPTPEENARRLLRQHENQNPYSISNILYRTEQAFALFLASLVPGVGERHVRAREDARRIIEEEERRQREEAERTQQEQQQQIAGSQASNQEKPAGVDTLTTSQPSAKNSAASSTAVASNSTDEGLRARTRPSEAS